ncbi:MAG: Lrp/AsnC family transcriptional regulator [bacterium]|nr:AsnC family transcriptional regulator [Deltaproteobacteria bacterium]MCP4905937.1 Lrp/AsnC family transcriptional regulator [bacterium]
MAANGKNDSEVIVDDLDKQIIELLHEDGRMSIQDIAQRLSSTSSTVRKRIRRLEDENIMRVVAVTDFSAAGYELLLAVGIQVENRLPEDVGQELAELDEVFSVNLTTGVCELDVLVAARNFAELSEFLHDKLPRISGIAKLAPGLTVDVMRYESEWVPII